MDRDQSVENGTKARGPDGRERDIKPTDHLQPLDHINSPSSIKLLPHLLTSVHHYLSAVSRPSRKSISLQLNFTTGQQPRSSFFNPLSVIFPTVHIHNHWYVLSQEMRFNVFHVWAVILSPARSSLDIIRTTWRYNGSRETHFQFLPSSLISHCPTITTYMLWSIPLSSHLFLPSFSLARPPSYHTHTIMSTPHSNGSRRSRQNGDLTSPQARTHIIRTRRPSFRHQHQQHRHRLPEEDRFVELRRSARIARLHQDQHRELHSQEQHPTSTMADVARRTYARNDHRPRSVE
jgi:hypothetical protein